MAAINHGLLRQARLKARHRPSSGSRNSVTAPS